MKSAHNKGLSQSTLRFFVRHVGQAAGRETEKEEKLSGIDSQIALLKKSARAPVPSKKKLETGLEELDKRIRDVVNQERHLVLNQRKEERILEELKERLDLLEEKIHGLSHVHSMTTDDHFKRISEMGSRLNEVSSRIAERKKARQNLEYNPRDIVSQINEIDKRKRDEIRKLEEMINQAERKHVELRKKKIPKKHIDHLRKTIDSHKKRLKEMKSK
ncbi:hypothetical protein GF345_01120 [Candidatus Woesearchaeota archaeon]|nr:hypothetical protein [Candidatus Woesearchaeota archaeon]